MNIATTLLEQIKKRGLDELFSIEETIAKQVNINLLNFCFQANIYSRQHKAYWKFLKTLNRMLHPHRETNYDSLLFGIYQYQIIPLLKMISPKLRRN